MYKKILVIATVFFAVFLFGCAKEAEVNKEGNVIKYSFAEIYQAGKQGVFILNSDGTYTPTLSKIPGYKGSTSVSSPTRYLWYRDTEEVNYTNLIPTVTPETPLVCIYRSNSALPSSWYIEGYEDKGYTIGVHFHTTEVGELYLEVQNVLSGTDAAAVIASSATPDKEYSVLKVNESDTLPLKNIDPNMRFLLGLEKDKLYSFSYYTGTIPRTISIFADTRLFQSSSYTTLTAPIKKTENGYFIVNLPVNLSSGYYYICNIGFFRYDAGENRTEESEEVEDGN